MADVDVLNDLLRAEYSAIKAYDAGAAILMNPPAGDPLASAAPTVLAVAVHFQSQHRDHAAELASQISAMAGTPVDAATVTFTVPNGFMASVANVMKLAANAEKAAAVSYGSAVNLLMASGSASIITSIGANETQHFIVLSLLIQGVVAPTATTQSMAALVVPKAFVSMAPAVSGVDTSGLEAVPDFTYTA